MTQLAIVVFACTSKERYKNEVVASCKTWVQTAIKNNIPITFYIGNESQPVKEFTNISPLLNFHIVPHCLDDHKSASTKQWYGIHHSFKEYNPDFLYIIGSDTYPFIESLLDLLKDYKCEERLYIGGHGDVGRVPNCQDFYFHSGGAGFLITRPIIKQIVGEEWHIKMASVCAKMAMTGQLVTNVDGNQQLIFPYQYMLVACDVSLAWLVTVQFTNVKVINHSDKFYACNIFGEPCHKNDIDLAKVVVVHFMTPELMMYAYDVERTIIKKLREDKLKNEKKIKNDEHPEKIMNEKKKAEITNEDEYEIKKGIKDDNEKETKEDITEEVKEEIKEEKNENLITLVTCFFNLHKYSAAVRPPEFYYAKGLPLLQTPLPMVVYCDEESYEPLLKMRPKNLWNITQWKVQSLKSFKTFQWEEQVRKNREICWATRDDRAPVESHLLVNSKGEMVEGVILENPFYTRYFGWIDFGITNSGCTSTFNYQHFISLLEKGLPEYGDSVAIQCMGDDIPNEMFNVDKLKEYWTSYRYLCCGNFWTCGIESGLEFAEQVYDAFVKHTQAGYGHGEEGIVYEVVNKEENFDLFSFRYGDYRQAIDNYAGVVCNPSYILNNLLPKLRAHGKHDRGYDCAVHFYQQWAQGLLNLSPDTMMRLLDDWWICAYYLQDLEIQYKLQPLIIVLQLCEKYPNVFGAEFNKNANHYITNYDYISLLLPPIKRRNHYLNIDQTEDDIELKQCCNYNKTNIDNIHNNEEVNCIDLLKIILGEQDDNANQILITNHDQQHLTWKSLIIRKNMVRPLHKACNIEDDYKEKNKLWLNNIDQVVYLYSIVENNFLEVESKTKYYLDKVLGIPSNLYQNWSLIDNSYIHYLKTCINIVEMAQAKGWKNVWIHHSNTVFTTIQLQHWQSFINSFSSTTYIKNPIDLVLLTNFNNNNSENKNNSLIIDEQIICIYFKGNIAMDKLPKSFIIYKNFYQDFILQVNLYIQNNICTTLNGKNILCSNKSLIML